MGEHLVLNVDRLLEPAVEEVEAGIGADKLPEVCGPSCSTTAMAVVEKEEGSEDSDEEQPLIKMAECRICQEEDTVKNLDIPCACSGSLKYAHRKCVQHWCNEKGDTTCEICHKPYQPGYTAPPHPHPQETAINIGGGWTISSSPVDLNDPRLLVMTEAERNFVEAEYDDYASTNASGAAFCRSAALILMALLLLRHALTMADGDGDDDVSTFSLFLASSCWVSLAMLYYGMGSQYSAASKTETGGCRNGSSPICICCTVKANQGFAFHNSISTHTNSLAGNCLP